MIHTGDIQSKIQEAEDTLFMAEKYISELGKEFEQLRDTKLDLEQVHDYIKLLLPLEEDASPVTKRNIKKLREDMTSRYFDAPDLKNMSNNAYRFINAVSDFATHSEPLRKTANYRDQIFHRTIEGNPMIDKAYRLVKAA